MNVLELAKEIGLDPKRTASTKGGEYKSSCPKCKEGKDRFCIWPKEGIAGTYWCRVCNARGDAIQFCRDFLGLGYIDACNKVKISPKFQLKDKKYYLFKKFNFSPSLSQPISEKWKERAKSFIEVCHGNLLANPQALNLLEERGIAREAINAFSLGWNNKDIYDSRTAWGLSTLMNDKGKQKMQWLPRGIVIPAFEQEGIVRIKIRRTDWTSTDKLPKYAEISGGLQRPSFYGDINKPIIVMESELDAILIQQFASDLCCCLALGGVGKRPDHQIHELLKKAPLILIALDYDEVGKKECAFWMQLYSNLRPWPARKGKSPGDSYSLYQVDIRKWVWDGLYFIQ